MNGLDIVILLLFIGGMFVGYRRGLVRQATSLVGWFLALMVAYQFSGSFADTLENLLPLSESATGGFLNTFFPIREGIYTALAFLILFLGVKFGFSILARLIDPLVKLPIIATVNRVGGLLFGLLKVFIVIFVLVNVMHLIPATTETVEESLLGRSIWQLSPDLLSNK